MYHHLELLPLYICYTGNDFRLSVFLYYLVFSLIAISSYHNEATIQLSCIYHLTGPASTWRIDRFNLLSTSIARLRVISNLYQYLF